MKFRRKSRTEPVAEEVVSTPAAAAEPAGPYDADDLPAGLVIDGWVDLGSLVLAPTEGRELRLQVDEASGTVNSVMLAGEDGALELRAFAAPRSGDLWSEALPLLRADISKRGGQVADKDGPWGPELLSQLKVNLPDGNEGVQVSRMIGISGPRWMLRATLLGRPAVEEDAGAAWERVLRSVVVRRGAEAKPKGEALEIVLPPEARRTDGQDAQS